MNLWIDTGGLARAESLFGLPPLERLRRSVGKPAADDAVTLSGPAAASQWPQAAVLQQTAPLGQRLRAALAASRTPLVVIDGGNVVDPRLIRFLGASQQACVAERKDEGGRAVALCLTPELAEAIPDSAASLLEVADALLASGRAARLDETRFPDYIDKLRRRLPYWIHAVNTAERRRQLERQLFWNNYKGSTDLLTAYVYPPLVWQAVRLCSRFSIHPNTVTVISIVLAFAAVPLWAAGHWLAGFACAYGMSVLDSVDGKVARLTLTDSKLGNILDHGLDQVHPPFWYYAWALGLGAASTMADPLYAAAIWLIVFYVADRLVLAVAKRRLKHALHSSTPLDERVRSIIARRNITMTIMAAALLLGQGEAGLYIVTAWQALTFGWHSFRTVWLGFINRPQEPA